MKKIFAVMLLVLFCTATTGIAGGDKVRADKAQGSAGTTGGGETTAKRGG